MEEVSIEKVSEDTPLTVFHKSREAKLRQKREWGFMVRQERWFLEVCEQEGVEVEEAVKEYWDGFVQRVTKSSCAGPNDG
jgi:hypothetical protein